MRDCKETKARIFRFDLVKSNCRNWQLRPCQTNPNNGIAKEEDEKCCTAFIETFRGHFTRN